MNKFELEIVPTLPRSLTKSESKNNPYPIHALGDILSPMAKVLNKGIQAPLALCGQSTLMAAALICQGMKNIKMPHGQFPLSLFSLSIAGSGERKTAVDKMAMAPISNYGKIQHVKYHKAMKEYKISSDAHDEHGKVIKKSFSNKSQASDIESALKSLGHKPEKPIQPTLVISDATIEGVVRHFIHARPVLGIYSSEGGAFFGGHSMSKDNVTKTIALFSNAWDGTPLDMMRADPATGSFTLFDKRLSISLMIQPIIANKIFSNPLLIDQGFIPRFLLCRPTSTMGTRMYRNYDICQTSAYTDYCSRLTFLLENELVFNEDPNDTELGSLTLGQAAMEKYIDFHDEVEVDLSVSGIYSRITGAAAKIAEQSLRIAGVLTIIKSGKSCSTIETHEMEAGVELARYSLHELLRMESQANIPQDRADAVLLLDWIQKKQHDYIYPQMLQQFSPNSIRNKERFFPALLLLSNHGYLLKIEGGIPIKDIHRQEVWQVLIIKPKPDEDH